MIFLDALRVKIRDGHRVVNKACYMAVGVDMDGIKHILGLWIADNEGAAFWASVCADLANRGVQDVFIVCCDGLKGLPEAVEATWPNSMVQTCIVHLLRNSLDFVSWKDRKLVAAALKDIYRAVDATAAEAALEAFEADPETEGIVMIGEIGGDAEERAAEYIKANVTKPVVGYVAGFTAPEGKTMGHAGAIVSGSSGTAQGKKEALEAAGVRVGKTPSEAARLMREIVGA